MVYYSSKTSSSFDCFQRIKALYNQGKEMDAIQQYFRNPNSFAASFLIARQNKIDMALKIYQTAKRTSSLDIHVIITLIGALEKRNEHQMPMIIDDLFDDLIIEIHKMKARDIAKVNALSWSTIIMGLCKKERMRNVMQIMDIIQKYEIKLDDRVYNFLLTICANKKWLELGKQVHNHIEKHGEINGILKSCLINMYGKCACLNEAVKIFDNIKASERDIITWNIMISAYGEHGRGREALRLYEQMQREGVKPNNQTVACIFKACCESGLTDNAAEILVSMQSKLGIKPNEYHYNCMLKACADKGLSELGKRIHTYIIENNHSLSIILKNNLINMYGKCGCLEEAFTIFNSIKLSDRDIITWNTMISVYGQNGKGKEALKLFEQMQYEGFLPDETTVTCVLNACSHSGLVQEALDIFYDLENKFKINPDAFHSACIVDVLSRAGRLEEAENFITNYMKKQKIKPDIVTWMTLLGACRTYMDVERAERVAQHIIDLDRKNATVYVLLSNIYAQTGNMNKREELRTLMDKKGIKKIPGISTVEVNGKVYEFISDDSLHPNIKEIHEELQLLTEEIIEAGYNPDISWITRDIESEEEKKELLCRHSEKLAMAWAMMNTAPGTTIRITKNLRVCGDCHSATKFISKTRNREIIIRDASRYHHFKDGRCSCGDYW
jgi:pentatricopeptide repeat protein